VEVAPVAPDALRQEADLVLLVKVDGAHSPRIDRNSDALFDGEV